MSLSPFLLEILACPEDKGPLYYVESESILYNPRLQWSYDVREGIPVMLIPDATALDATDHARIMGLIAAHGIRPTFEPSPSDAAVEASAEPSAELGTEPSAEPSTEPDAD